MKAIIRMRYLQDSLKTVLLNIITERLQNNKAASIHKISHDSIDTILYY